MKKLIYVLLFIGLQSCSTMAVQFNQDGMSGPLHVVDDSILLTNILLIIIMITLFVIAKRLNKLLNYKYPKIKPTKEKLSDEEVDDVISSLKRDK